MAAFVFVAQADLEAAVGTGNLKSISDQTGTAIDTVKVGAACSDSNAEIEAVLQNRPGYPFSTRPDAAVPVGVALSLEKLYLRVWGYVPAAWKLAADGARQTLEMLREGKIVWTVGNAQTPPADQVGQVYTWNPADDPGSDNPKREALRRSLDLL